MTVAMILAAGRGERLKPLTTKIPKALCIVHGKPLIEHHVSRLVAAGIERIIINHAYLGGQIRQYLGDGRRYGAEIIYSPEPPGGLETGGGLMKALPLLGNQPFLSVNADIYTDFDFGTLTLLKPEYAHLILVPKNPVLKHVGDFGLIDHQWLTNQGNDFTYPGIAVYNPAFFEHCRQGRYSVAPLIRKFADERKITATEYHGMWFDIGSLERLQAANRYQAPDLIED
jgi:N-acetyl-alpha-D-muramate 1-phosphate uridylyltransferase